MKRELPRDPMMRQLIQMSRNRTFTRRAALTGIGGSAAALALASCTTGEAEDRSDTEKVLTWHNWDLYMDETDAGDYGTLGRFEVESGIDVEYMIEIDDNDTWFAKYRDQLALGQDIGADIACPTGWMASRMLALGYLQKFNNENLPNKVANISPGYLNAPDDPNAEYRIPWQGGFAGIGYNKAAYKEATGKDAPSSVADLWAAEIKGRVGLLSEMRDTMGVILMSQGIDITNPESLTQGAFDEAIALVAAQISSGQIFNVKGNSYKEDMINGNSIAAVCWSGDIFQMNYEMAETTGDPEFFGFAFPDTGVTIWADYFVTPKGATHKKNAEALINFYYDPANAAELAVWNNYISPVVGAREAMAELDPGLAESELIFPSSETLAQAKAFRTLTAEEDQLFSNSWQNLLLGA